MGLGKTVQSISALNYVFETFNMRGPFLIVAPMSTMEHWKREIENWTEMNAVVFHGSQVRFKLKSQVEKSS
jgi:SNF2 family DNA or RNA helicase